MTREDWLDFEIYIGDLLERQEIKSGSDLQNISEELHEHIEYALSDYADDNNLSEDYTPMF